MEEQNVRGESWIKTSEGEARGYIDTGSLKELWFHTGTVCNLQCPDCFEHSGPKSKRLGMLSFDDAKALMDEAIELGIKQFSFTGGEPFVTKDIIKILDYALDHVSCLVLSNGTKPLFSRMDELYKLVDKSYELSFRISLDYPDQKKHDASRGEGMFELAMKGLTELHKAGFHVSVARHREDAENVTATDDAYRPLFELAGLPANIPIISFPDLERDGTPEITENCMTSYRTQEEREAFMCAFSRMVIKKDGQVRVYACTLVDDDPNYDFGTSIRESIKVRTMLKHKRCYSCFGGSMSCSEI